MAITRTSQVDDDGSGTTGTIWNNAWKQELYNQIDAMSPLWAALPFNVSNFTASSGAWNVSSDIVDIRWSRAGNVVFVQFGIQGAQTITASTVQLRMRLETLLPASGYTFSTFHYYLVGGVQGVGACEMSAAGVDVVTLLRDSSGTPWPPSSGACYLRGEFFYPVA